MNAPERIEIRTNARQYARWLAGAWHAEEGRDARAVLFLGEW
jgi:hypothetical protein